MRFSLLWLFWLGPIARARLDTPAGRASSLGSGLPLKAAGRATQKATTRRHKRHGAREPRLRQPDELGRRNQSVADLRGGSVANPTDPRDSRPLALYAGAFLFITALSLVSLYPAPHLVKILGENRATSLLATVASASALTEIVSSSLIAALVDALGRKPVLIGAACVVALSNALVGLFASHEGVLPFVAAKFTASIAVGVFFLSSGAILADLYRSTPKKLAASNGLLFALVNAGFGVGVGLSGVFKEGLGHRLPYLASSLIALGGVLALALGVPETMAPSERKPLSSLSRGVLLSRIANPFNFVRLLRQGPRLRLLTILVALHSAPMFMGDVLQVFVYSEWGLKKSDVVALFSLLATTGTFANVAAALGAVKLFGGLRGFNAAATLSGGLFWLALLLGDYKAALLCTAVGFLGQAKSIPAATLVATEGAQAGLTQGQIAGDRANLIAWLKVVGPLFYQRLYVEGKRQLGFPALPFALNALLALAALLVGHTALRPPAQATQAGGEAGQGADGKNKGDLSAARKSR